MPHTLQTNTTQHQKICKQQKNNNNTRNSGRNIREKNKRTFINQGLILSTMDAEISTIIQTACYSAAALGGISIFTLARYSFLKRKSDNETYVERMRVDIEESQQAIEISKQRIQLMETQQYQKYLEARQNASHGFSEYANNANADLWNSESLENYLNAIVGPNPLD